ncbi:MAG TPA: phosphopantetheine-binding protein [Pyrinomonadaceae bacterium]|nr:phosphopantetheine-binding protein [Pyrinomonadaceae bacterium]
MTADEIRAKVKSAISSTAGLDAGDIPDDADYREDLQLDSLTILEIAVSLEYQFRLDIPDEELTAVRTIGDTVGLIRRYAKTPEACAPE